MLMRAFAVLLALSSAVSAEVPDNLARADLMSGWRDGATHVSGLTIQMAPGWHTYWRAPGDAGIPPSFNWSGSSNVQHVRVQFPVPEIYEAYGMRSIGYVGQVTFPLLIETKDASKPVRLRGEIEIGVCDEICVPVTLNVQADLPAKGSRHQGLARLLNNRPETGGRMTCTIAPIADGLRVTATADVPRMKGTEMAVIETGNSTVWVSPATLQRSGTRLQAEVEMVAATAKPFALARAEVRMTVIADGRAIEMLGCN